MGKSKARSAAALKAHAAVPAPAVDETASIASLVEPPAPRARYLRSKIEYLRANTRSAIGLSKVYLNATDMGNYGIEAGACVALHASDTDFQTLLLCGVAWPLDKIKRGGVGVSAMWEAHTGATATHALVLPLQHPESRVRRREASEVTLRLESRASSSSTWPSEKEKPLLQRYISAMLDGVLIHTHARLALTVHGVNTVFSVASVASDASADGCVYRVSSAATAVSIQWTQAEDPPSPPPPSEQRSSSPSPPATPKPSRGFAAIGGLQQEIQTIREIIEQPLINPQLFAKFGLPPPKGLLLFGPPGTGKTMIARALASELRASIFFINGPEVVSKFIGESEANLRDVFRRAAQHAPSLVFIDEIDAICPKRDGSRVGEMDKRMVATLLTLLDGLETQAQVVVLGATNRPNALDPAVRRPGRFDREVEIGIPSAAARREILAVSLASLPHRVATQALNELAANAHGYVGADLSALVKEAALLALQRSSSSSGDHTFCIELADLQAAMRHVRPSALREIAIDVPRVLWRDIGGQAALQQQLREAVEWPLRHPQAFVRMGIRPPKGVLLYGPPGCSKTLTAKALATESAMNFIAIKGPELFSKWVGESEQAVRQVFTRARAAAPTLVFFDEIDAIASARGGDGSSQVADRVLSQLLTELDGIEPLKQVLVVAATNRPDLLDRALLRPGRIDRVLYVGPPDAAAREEILRIHCRGMPLDGDVELQRVAVETDGFSGAELYALCREAAMHAIQDDRDAASVALRHFEAARAAITPQIDAKMLQFFERFRDGVR